MSNKTTERVETKISGSVIAAHSGYQAVSCLHEIFEGQVDQNPDAPALLCGRDALTYRETDSRANRFAALLRSLGVGPGTLVGLYCDRSAKAIIGMLGVLKAGAGYVPIDPSFPEERVRYILRVAGIETVLISESLRAKAENLNPRAIVSLDDQDRLSAFSSRRVSRQEVGTKSSDLCYVIFTSGTTGRPKGVMAEHRNVVKFVSAFRTVCALTSEDRVLQAFSLGFDGSVEEIWMAFSSGATLVVCPPDVTRLGDELARVINENHVTFYSTVPTSLSMIGQGLPSVRLLVVSGEPCPPELIDQWATGDRRMLNVYGPTETTVNATFAECIPRRPVTIGKPLDGYDFHLLNSECRPVPEGQSGELFIGGIGLARGYMSEPELTAKSFLDVKLNGNGKSTRLYRTGDLVKWGDDGELLFLGRIDTQVKIRGYRIELAEIEAVLLESPLIRSAVVNVYEHDGVKELAAYVTKEPGSDDELESHLRLALDERLPAYMVPRYLDVLDEIPRLTSGKADRQNLPKPRCPLLRCCNEAMLPDSDVERNIANQWQKIFGIEVVSTLDNFFTDLGGYSLIAAQMVSALRREFGYEVALREVYEHPTIKELGQRIGESKCRDNENQESDGTREGRPSAKEVYESSSQFARWVMGGFQALSLYAIYGLSAVPATLGMLLYLGISRDVLPLEKALIIGGAMFFGYFPMMLLLSIAVKWLVIGRYKRGRYSIWSSYYFRWWFVTRIQALSGVRILEGTPVLNWYFRLMGAKLGKRCVIDSSVCYAFDLVKIGDDSCIGNETQLPGYRVEDGMLIIGGVSIGERCFVGIHSYLGLDVCLANDARLGDLSTLNDGDSIEAGLASGGSPARSIEVDVPKIESTVRKSSIPAGLLGIMQWAVVYGLQIFILLISAPSLFLLIFAFRDGGIVQQVLALLCSGPLAFFLFCLGVPVLKKLILSRVDPGVYSVNSWFYLRKWTVDSLIRMSRRIALPLYTTIYFPPWLRLLGAKIGSHAEIATVSQISPDLMEISEGSFFADGSIIGGRHFYRGHVELAKSRVGSRSFIGNSAILPIGANVGDGCLIGCLSAPPPNLETLKGSEWLGSPAFNIPFRRKVESFGEELTFRPTRKLYAQRCVVDLLRIVIPSWIAVIGSVGFILSSYWIFQSMGLWALLLLSPAAGILVTILSVLLVVLVKKGLIGTFEPIVKPLWSPFVWFNEAVNGAYESVMAPMLSPMLGTPFFAFFLRLIGCKIGRGVFLETTLFSEFDLVEIGDHSSVNLGAIIQNHLFEDRIMKASWIKVREQANIGNMAVVL
ncbi:amino acid adenylation domain-containing protein, partial [Verrucomicrobia bacterium]|nr:amino acid adenylation domain-containing protein [Verrucomicrobiota bacterium]